MGWQGKPTGSTSDRMVARSEFQRAARRYVDNPTTGNFETMKAALERVEQS